MKGARGNHKECRCAVARPIDVGLMGGRTVTMCRICKKEMPDKRWSTEGEKRPDCPAMKDCTGHTEGFICAPCGKRIVKCSSHGEFGHGSHE